MGAEDAAHYDVLVVGGGHNGLVAAAYLAREGMTVRVLERSADIGGAAVNARPFNGVPARISRYATLVGLLPHKILHDLELNLELRPRQIATYTPTVRDGVPTGLVVERSEGALTRESFRNLTGRAADYDAWRSWHQEVSAFARVLAPSLLQPLVRAREMSSRVDPEVWQRLVMRPLGEAIEERFDDDLVRGLVASDAVVGTFASLHDPTLVQNRTFLYHVIGNGTGERRVPVGGMGAISAALASLARRHGAELSTGSEVLSIASDGEQAEVVFLDGAIRRRATARWVLGNSSPYTLEKLLGGDPPPSARPVGSQLSINFLVTRLPRLKSGQDPRTAFAGTFRVASDYSDIQKAYEQAAGGAIPDRIPGELTSHSLTDSTVLDPMLALRGVHSLSYFGHFTPSSVIDKGPMRMKTEAVERAVATINEHLAEPLEDCLARAGDGRPCLEAHTTSDLERDLAMPGGNIFHGNLQWPWVSNHGRLDSPAQRWGVSTAMPNVLVCGSGAQRGGAISGIGGHNAARAVLESA